MNNELDLLRETFNNISFHKDEQGEYLIETHFSPVGMNIKYCACNIGKDNTVEDIENALLDHIRYCLL